MSRPSWDETWMDVAHVVGERSKCVRDKVGAVIVDMQQRVVATGYNGPPRGLPMGLECSGVCPRGRDGPRDPMSYDDCVAIHAELNALMFADRRQIESGTIYVTGSVCFTCAKPVSNSGLYRVVIAASGIREYRSPEDTVTFMQAAGMLVDVLE